MEFIIRLFKRISYYIRLTYKYHVPINQKQSSRIVFKFLNFTFVHKYCNLKIEYNAQDFLFFTLIKNLPFEQLLSLIRIQKISILLIEYHFAIVSIQNHRASLQIPRGFLFRF